jgi:hypothetical protein
VISGSDDFVVPPAESRIVARAAPALWRLVAVDGADHNDPVLLDSATLIGAVVELAEQVNGAS